MIGTELATGAVEAGLVGSSLAAFKTHFESKSAPKTLPYQALMHIRQHSCRLPDPAPHCRNADFCPSRTRRKDTNSIKFNVNVSVVSLYMLSGPSEQRSSVFAEIGPFVSSRPFFVCFFLFLFFFLEGDDVIAGESRLASLGRTGSGGR